MSGISVRICLVWLALTVGASASAGTSSSETKVTGYENRGPKNYHQTYASIFNTVVVLQGYSVRTNDGQVIRVPSPRMTVDLQDLKDFKRGLLLDMRKVVRAGQFVDVVEIQAHVVDCSNHYLNFRDKNQQFGSQCKLRTPKTINLYTVSAPEPMGAFEYLVKVDFNPLNSIQLDLVKVFTAKKECWNPFGDFYQDICKELPEKVTRAKSCELANRRQPILRIVRAIDEA